MDNLISEKIDKFFEDTRIYHGEEVKEKGFYKFSILYLLVRDIKTCFGIDPATNKSFTCKNCGNIAFNSAQWPALMGILAGIDLLGKFYAGSDGVGVGDRFKNFIYRYFIYEDKNLLKDVLYELRNSMLHSFGLYSDNYNLVLIANNSNPIIKINNDNVKNTAVINVSKLYLQFLEAIEKYHDELKNNEELKDNFDRMFGKYGISTHYKFI